MYFGRITLVFASVNLHVLRVASCDLGVWTCLVDFNAKSGLLGRVLLLPLQTNMKFLYGLIGAYKWNIRCLDLFNDVNV